MIMWLIFFLHMLFIVTTFASKFEPLKPNKEIVVGFSNRPPFVFQDQNGAMKGLDVLIIENFAKKANLQIKYKQFDASLNEMFGREDTFENVLMSSIFREIDVFIGALDESLVTSKHFIASRAYYQDVLTWCVQTKQPIPMWKNIFYLCRDPMVLGIYTVMCFTVVFTGYFMQRFEDLQPKWDWFQITLAGFAPNVGFPSPYEPKILPHRIAYLACVFGAMITYILINSLIILFMSTPIYENQIESIHEINKGGYELTGDEFSLQHLKKQSQEYPMDLLKNFMVCDDLDVCLSQLNRNPKLAVAISREHAHNSRLISISELYCFDNFETIHKYALKFLIRKEFTYKSGLNHFIQMASAGGLIEKWRSISRIRSQYAYEKKFYGIITLENFYGIFLIFISILAHLILLHFFENIVNGKARKPNPFRFWLFIEMVIDPYRHFWLENVSFWK